MPRTHKQRDGRVVTAPRTINVPMDIEEVRLVDDDGRLLFQIHGHVGDYGVSIWMNEDEAKAAGITARSR